MISDEEILDKLIWDITIAGYGKEDQPNNLIEEDDVQPFAGYEICKQKALAAIEEIMVAAKPKDWVRSDLIEGYDLGIRLYEQNIRQAFSNGGGEE